jgi:two-component system, OmpR family, phosphate regulon sensor histidine kinase PhoR
MLLKKIVSYLNVPGRCKRYGVSVWQCPEFLFLLMGACIAIASFASFFIGSKFVEDSAMLALVVISATTFFLIIAFVVNKSFEKLIEVSKLKSEFIDIVSHQMRSPLTNLKWTIELLASKEIKFDTVKEAEYYENIKENIERMVELIDDLLVVSKVEDNEAAVRKVDFSFDDMVKDIVSRYQVFSKASNVEMKFSCQENLPKIFADSSWLKLAVENLIDNAMHYTKGGGKIDIYLKIQENKFLFSVKDSGIGIPEIDQKFIFQKFFRAQNVSKKETRGSGLGLYITKKIIEKSGGKIWFESKEGIGTAFNFILPIK